MNANERQDDFMGLCPVCHKRERMLNVGSEHFVVCVTHRLFWRFGSNMFSCWRSESEETHEQNAEFLMDCGEVEGFHWPETLALAKELPPPPLGGAFI